MRMHLHSLCETFMVQGQHGFINILTTVFALPLGGVLDNLNLIGGDEGNWDRTKINCFTSLLYEAGFYLELAWCIKIRKFLTIL